MKNNRYYFACFLPLSFPGRRGLALWLLATTIQCASPARPAPPAERVIRVTNAAEFLSQIGSDRVLELAAGDYLLPEKAPAAASAHVRFEKVFDGHQIVLSDLHNLTIKAAASPGAISALEADAAGPARPRLLARPRYANVLTFENTRDLRIMNLVAGHQQEGYCTGGVLVFRGSRRIRIEGSELFGSGTEGLTLDDVSDLEFRDSLIRDCSYGILTMRRARKILFAGARFRGNREFDLINIADSDSVVFDRVKIERNRTGLESYARNALFHLTDSDGIVLRDSSLAENRTLYFQKYRGQALKIERTELDRSQFKRGLELELK